MVFKKLREQVKIIGIIIVVAFVAGSLYIGGSSFFGGGQEAQMAQAAIATVNGEDISYYQFQQQFINEVQRTEQQQGRLEGMDMERIRYQALESLVGNALLRQEIANRQIEVPRAEVDEQIAQIKEQFESEEEYQQQLQWMGIDETYLRNAIEQDLRMDKLREQVAGDIVVPEEEIREAYEQVQARHILIRPLGTDEDAWEHAYEHALEIYSEVTTETFADFARAYSDDTGSAANGGDVGFIGWGDTVEPFEQAAFSLAIGEISEPVRSTFGYHIITVTDRIDAEGEEFDEARGQIEQSIRQQLSQVILMEWFDDLREEATIVIRDPQLQARAYVNEGNYEEAIAQYQVALEEQPDNGYVYAAMGEAYRRLERPEDALAQYQNAVEHISNDPILFQSKGDLHRQLEQIDEAVEAYLTASELRPNDLWFQLNIYNSIGMMDRWEDAQVIEERITAIQEASAPAPTDTMPLEELEALEEEGILDDLDVQLEDATDAAAEATDTAVEAATGMAAEAGEMAEDVLEDAGDIAEAIAEDAQDAAEIVADDVEDAVDAAGSLADEAAEAIEDLVDTVEEAFGSDEDTDDSEEDTEQ